MNQAELKQRCAEAAVDYVVEDEYLGVGTGTTVGFFITALAKSGKRVKGCVSSSEASTRQLLAMGFPVADLNEVDKLPVYIDGADEIDDGFHMIKGGGGALYREKVVATLAKEVIWIVDESKLVDQIGAFHLPVEIAQYGAKQAVAKMEEYGWHPVLRVKDGKPYVTDNGNYIADLHLGAGFDIGDVKTKLGTIIGVLEHGLFLNLCKRVIVGTKDGVRVIENQSK